MYAAIELTLTIAPPPARRIDGCTVFMPRNAPVRLVSITRRHSSIASSAIGSTASTPALLTSTEIGPNASSAKLTAACHEPSSVTSSAAKRAPSPSSSATAAPSASSTSPTTTRAPSAASARACASPIPRAPPVTSATLPSSLAMNVRHIV